MQLNRLIVPIAAGRASAEDVVIDLLSYRLSYGLHTWRL